MAEILLTGVPAFVCAVKGPTTVGFVIDENLFDPTKVIEVDLAKNPNTVPPGQWDTDVDVDYQTTGGWTTIGPRFHGGIHVGGAYLAPRLAKRYASALAGWPPPGDALYQYQAVLREENGVIARYHGFKVRVMSPGRGTLAHLGFIRPGTRVPSLGVNWVDLADPTMCDPAAHGFTTITPQTPVGSEGALFLTSGGMTAMSKPGPKYPPGDGW